MKNNQVDKNMVKAVIFDWAGTAVDYGCMAPQAAFKTIFDEKKIELEVNDIRRFMGLNKLEHIKLILSLDYIKEQWKDRYGIIPGGEEAKKLYSQFEPFLIDIVARYSDPVPGMVELCENLREKGIKIGSTTGYNDNIMKILTDSAKEKGYSPDSVVTPDRMPAGRPAPYMCYQNAINLEVYPMGSILKVGDTLSDIHEGLNAGMWTAAVVKGSNDLGLSLDEVNAIDSKVLEDKCKTVRERYIKNGVHFIAETISDIIHIIDEINNKTEERL